MTLGVAFDNPSKTYTPGQIVTGKVFPIYNSDTNVKGLEIKVTGIAQVRWEEERTESEGTGENRTDRTVTEVYSDLDKVFSYNFFALGDGRTEIGIPAGRHEYPFEFTLPPLLPSTFVGMYGSVAYEVEAIMIMAKGSNDKVKNDFLVKAILDLNAKPEAAQPADARKSKTICCLCCASGPILAILKVPRSGFVAGDFIPIQAEIQNNSSRNVSGVTITLVQVCTYHTRSSRKFDVKSLLTAQRPSVERGDSEVIREDILQIPSVPITDIGGCRIIQVQYTLNMEVKIGGPSKPIKVSTPIIIGTIPLGNASVEDVLPWNPAFNPYYAPTPTAPPVMPFYEQDPPSYCEANNAGGQTKFFGFI